jgi:hypothetical protein
MQRADTMAAGYGGSNSSNRSNSQSYVNPQARANFVRAYTQQLDTGGSNPNPYQYM